MDRRTFILRSSTTLATVSSSSLAPLATASVAKWDKAKKALDDFRQQDWITIATVQSHMFPSEPTTSDATITPAPGALEINALGYLQAYLSNPATEITEVKFILSGVHLLHKTAHQKMQKSFNALAIEQRETLLRSLEKQAEGRRWLITLLNYVLEALLTDPIYGGNPNGIGWQWLEHQAGEPRPPKNKRYWLL